MSRELALAKNGVLKLAMMTALIHFSSRFSRLELERPLAAESATCESDRMQ